MAENEKKMIILEFLGNMMETIAMIDDAKNACFMINHSIIVLSF